MTELKVVVVDDEPEIARTMAERIRRANVHSEFTITTRVWSGDELRESIHLLAKRESSSGPGERTDYDLGDLPFDDADVAVIDYDLRTLFKDQSAFMTGETLASLVRRFTSSGPIVSVNRFGRRRFDLTLRGRQAGWADLSVAHEDLENVGLWNASWTGYRPWYWPTLSSFVEVYSRRVAVCLEMLDLPAWNLFTDEKGLISGIPKRYIDTVGDLFGQSPRELMNKIAPLGKARNLPDPVWARMAASEMGRWLDGTVAPPQDALIDAPHLASLFPSLVQGASATKEALDRLAKSAGEVSTLLNAETIFGDAYSGSFPADRVLWWTDAVTSNPNIGEVRDPATRRDLQFVFSEDTAEFLPRDQCTEFAAEGLFLSRWIRRPDDSVDYSPASRLAQ